MADYFAMHRTTLPTNTMSNTLLHTALLPPLQYAVTTCAQFRHILIYLHITQMKIPLCQIISMCEKLNKISTPHEWNEKTNVYNKRVKQLLSNCRGI